MGGEGEKDPGKAAMGGQGYDNDDGDDDDDGGDENGGGCLIGYDVDAKSTFLGAALPYVINIFCLVAPCKCSHSIYFQ